MTTFLKYLGGTAAIAILFAFSFVATYYGAWVLGKQWEWLIQPSGYEPLPLPVRIGAMAIFTLLLLPHALTYATTGKDSGESDSTFYTALMKGVVMTVGLFFAYSMSLLVAYIWKLYL